MGDYKGKVDYDGDTVTVNIPHSWCYFYNYDGERIEACTCQIWQLEDGDIEDGKVPDELPPLERDCPYRGGAYSREDLNAVLEQVERQYKKYKDEL